MSEDDAKRKSKLLDELSACDNPYILQQVEKNLSRQSQLRPLAEMAKTFPAILKEGYRREKAVKRNLSIPRKTALARYDSYVRPFFVFISLLMLMLAAAILNIISYSPENLRVILFQGMLVRIYLIGWLLYFLDFAMVLYLARRAGAKIAMGEFIPRMLSLLFPPLRLGSRHIQKVELTWLPFYGWCKCNEGLQKQLKHRFSIPMIVIALLIIPVLLIEWKFYDEVSAFLNTDLSFLLDVVQAFIWMAFAFEFILMFSISTDKMDYAVKNWVDILIILLPFISFIRTMRIIRIARLSQLARGYKLRGLLMKAKEGFIFASFFKRILTLRPGFQVNNLKKKLEKNQREREILEEELMELYETLRAQQQ